MKKTAIIITIVALIGILVSGAVFASDVTDPKTIVRPTTVQAQ